MSPLGVNGGLPEVPVSGAFAGRGGWGHLVGLISDLFCYPASSKSFGSSSSFFDIRSNDRIQSFKSKVSRSLSQISRMESRNFSFSEFGAVFCVCRGSKGGGLNGGNHGESSVFHT